MGLKIFLLLVNLQVIFCQNEILQSTYSQQTGRGYTSEIKIINPNGLNNFQNITGNHLPGMINDNVEFINFGYSSNTSNFPSIFCDTYKNSKGIYMYNNGVTKLEENSFSNCKIITSISCSSNRFTSIPEKSFMENSELTYLGILRNLISSLHENAFINQQKLETLYVNGNRLTDLPRNIFRPLRNLKELDIAYNILTNLRVEWFETLENLILLNAGGNKFEELPRNIFAPLKNIHTIYLNDNRLTVLNSKSFGTLPTLQQLIVSSNQITAIDEKLVDDTGVVFMQMDNNVCSTELMISDRSDPLKMTMRSYLKKCFENFEYLLPGCPIGNLDQRVCKLEENKEEVDENYRYLYQQIAELKDENVRMQPVIYEMQKYLEKQNTFEEQFKTIVAAVERLLNQVFN